MINIFLKQWYEKISIDYAYSTKNKRKKEFMHLIDKMCNFYNYDEYKNLNKEIKALAKKYNCNENDLEYGEYEEEIVW